MNAAAIRALPLSHRCAVELFFAYGERTAERLDALCEHFERVYGMKDPHEIRALRDRAAIAAGLVTA